MVKAGGFLGTRPFDTYYDMGRIGRFNPGIGAHVVPRFIPVCFFLAGLIHFIRRRSGFRWLILLPVAVAAASSLVFVHCERFSLPVMPLMLLAGASGITIMLGIARDSLPRSLLPAAAGLLLLVPALVWPVPSIDEGMYVYSLGIRAYSMGDFDLSLELFQRSGVLCPEGSVLYVESHRQAAVIADALGYRRRGHKNHFARVVTAILTLGGLSQEFQFPLTEAFYLVFIEVG